jgi:membrane protein
VQPDPDQEPAESHHDRTPAEESPDTDGLEALAPAPGPSTSVPPFGERHMWSDGARDYHPGPLPLEHQGPARVVETGVLTVGRSVDRLQSRVAPIAFGYGVMKKYFDDEGSRLAAVMAYYTFLSLFPLMIGGVAILNLVLRNDPERAASIIEDVVPEQFQEQVLASYQALPSVIMAFAVVVTSAGGGVVGAWFDVPAASRVVAAVLTVAVFSGSLYGSARLLCRRPLGPHELLLGAVLGGVIVTTIVSLGSWLVSSFVATSTPIYGAFATVIGVISVLVLTSNGLVLALEISVVRAWQLWPRGIDIHLLFPADERAYVLLSLMDERMPSQRNDVRFDADGHFDPRRPAFDTLDHRQAGVPRTPYDDA